MKIFFYILSLFFLLYYPRSSRLSHFYGIAMEMPYHVQVAGSISKKKQAHIESIIASTFAFIHACFDHWNPNSELSLLNQLPILQEKKLSPKLLELFTITDALIKISEGRFNPCLGHLISLWKTTLPKKEKVDAAMIESIRKNLSVSNFYCKKGYFLKSSPCQLDFDGIAKGFGIDLLLKRLQIHGYKNVYVEWAGDIAVSGTHPNGRHWQVAIRDPNSYRSDSEIILLSQSAIATSGDYEQYWEIEDKRYCHIIDPNTLYPMEIKEGSIASVTVMAPSCAWADGLATSAMTFTEIENLFKWAHSVQKEIPEVSFWFFIRDYSDKQTQIKKYKI